MVVISRLLNDGKPFSSCLVRMRTVLNEVQVRHHLVGCEGELLYVVHRGRIFKGFFWIRDLLCMGCKGD